MKKIITTTILTALASSNLFAQNIGMGTSTPNASAKLEITSANSGLLIPRIALTATNVAAPVTAPATSLLVYNTATSGVSPNNVTPGYYFWTGTAWSRLLNSASSDWTLLGNAGTVAATNFIGTTDAVDFVTRTNNLERMRVLASGGIQVTSPNFNANAINPAIDVQGAWIRLGDALGNQTFTNGMGIKFHDSGVNHASMQYISSSNFINFGTSGGNGNALALDLAATPALAIDLSNRRIGIGTNAPAEAIHAIGNIRSSTLGGVGSRLVASDVNGTLTNIATGTNGQVLTLVAGVPAWATSATTAWNLTGNAGTNAATNFIGTTDAVAFSVRTNNIEHFRITSAGAANIWSGGNYAVPNGYMAAGSLTIGNTNTNFGGGSGWNTNTTGLMLEALDNTEISAHDYGTRLVSLSYYEGAANRIHIGRDMGWGTISTISLNGNVGVGIVAPTQKFDVQGGNARINNAFIGDVGHGATWAGFANSSSATTTGYALLQSTTGDYTLINKQNTGSGYIGFRIANNDVAVITNAGNMGIGTTATNDKLYVTETQLTAEGDGQSTIYGYRTRDSQNDGTGYGIFTTNNSMTGYNFWGDLYTFGVHGASFGDFTRTGGVLGSVGGSISWGILGYKTSASTYFGVYGSSGYGTGAGYLPTADAAGIGGGFFGDLIGSVSKGAIIGQLNTGELFAQYNSGNTFTLGKNIELVETETNSTVAVYSVTSTEATVYSKGNAKLNNGEVYIAFDAQYKSLLGENPVVTVSPTANCNGLYISSVDKNGFTVKELMNGASSATFAWIAVGNRIDNRLDAATKMVTAPNFDRNVQQVLFNDNNKEGKAQGIWWNGSEIQFGEIPAHLAGPTKTGK